MIALEAAAKGAEKCSEYAPWSAWAGVHFCSEAWKGDDKVKLVLKLVGRDSWSRPVYEADGRLYVDTDPRAGWEPCICTKYKNAFDGEPCDPVTAEFEFVPGRDVWY